jgi:hypothetical protein
MAENIAQKTCTPCRGGIPPLTEKQAGGYLSQTPGWNLLEAGHLIRRKFKFTDFREALTFVDGVGRLAEEKGTIRTSASAGATRKSRCRPIRSGACTRTISSWQRRSIS